MKVRKIAITKEEAKKAMRDGVFISIKTSEEPYLPPTVSGTEVLGTILGIPDEDGFVTVDIIGYRNDLSEKWRLKLFGGVDAQIKNIRFVGKNPTVAKVIKQIKAKDGVKNFCNILPNTADAAVNYAVEAIKEVEANRSKKVVAQEFDPEAHQWIVIDHDLRKAYLVDLLKCTHKEIDLKGRKAKAREALWPFSSKLPSKFNIEQRCLCDYFGLPCTGQSKIPFEKTKEGWRIKGQLSPLSDKEVATLLKSCKA